MNKISLTLYKRVRQNSGCLFGQPNTPFIYFPLSRVWRAFRQALGTALSVMGALVAMLMRVYQKLKYLYKINAIKIIVVLFDGTEIR